MLMLSTSGEWHPCRVLSLDPFTAEYDVTVGLSHTAFMMLEYAPSIPTFWRIF